MGKEVDLYLNENVDIVHLDDEDINDFTYQIKINDVKLPLEENDIVGYLEIKINDNCYLIYELITKERIEKKTFFKIWWNNIVKSTI